MGRVAAPLAGSALVAALAAAVYIVFFATNTAQRCDASGCVTTHPKAVDDPAVAILAFVPAAICTLGLAMVLRSAPKSSLWLVALPSFLACLISFFSVGFPFMPAALLLLLAAGAHALRQPAEPA